MGPNTGLVVPSPRDGGGSDDDPSVGGGGGSDDELGIVAGGRCRHGMQVVGHSSVNGSQSGLIRHCCMQPSHRWP